MQHPHRRSLFRFVLILVAIAFAAALLFALHQYPRIVLLSDVRDSERIIVDWRLRADNGTIRTVAYELDDSLREAFDRTLTDNLALDYSRTTATVTPMIGVYLVDDDGLFKAHYVIRCARNIEISLPMDSLRNIAAMGRRLSEHEVADIFGDDSLRSKWPHILPWPTCRYDYVLPSQSNNALANED